MRTYLKKGNLGQVGQPYKQRVLSVPLQNIHLGQMGQILLAKFF